MIKKFTIAKEIIKNIIQPVSIFPQRCNRLIHKNSKCNICESNCPTSAIKVGNVSESIDIDENKCLNCGICLASCPTGAFYKKEQSHQSFLNSIIDNIHKNTLELHCKNNKEDSIKKGYAFIDCYGRITIPDLLYFYINGASKIRINIYDCSICNKRYGIEILNDELSELMNISINFKYLNNLKIFRKSSYVEIIFPRIFKTIENIKDEEILTRRNIATFTAHNIRKKLIKTINILIPHNYSMTNPIRRRKAIPPTRVIFKRVIEELLPVTEEIMKINGYFFKPLINKKCNMCGVCARFCPTGALKESITKNAIIFNASDCVSCGLCLNSCFFGFVTPDLHVNLKDFFYDVTLVKVKQ